MMTCANRRVVWILMAAFFLCSAALSEVLRPGHDQYVSIGLGHTEDDYKDPAGARAALRATPFQTLLPTVLGVREVLASLMWVRADDYFHRGEYKPILTMCKEITAIDPHQLDVYATGAWHMAYNFMDKRLIQDGVEFLQEGCAKNPSVYDLFFELGYMHYDKTKDFPRAVQSYGDASTKKTTQGDKAAPAYVRHQLAHAMEKMGDIDRAIAQWKANVAASEAEEKGGENPFMPMGPNTQAARHNLYITVRRLNERLAAIAERDGNRPEAIRLWERNVQLAQESLKRANDNMVRTDLNAANAHLASLRAGKTSPLQPADLDLHFTVTRIAPRKVRVDGDLNVLDLSRVSVMLRDRGYDEEAKKGFNYKMGTCTMEWDSVPVNKGKFQKIFDLNKDPADMDRPPSDIYPLKAQDYDLVVSFNPRVQAAFIQDRYGWHGEGLDAKDGLKTDPERSGVMDGKRFPLRLVEKSVSLKRDDVLAPGQKVLYKG